MAGQRGRARTAVLLHHRSRAAEPDGVPRPLVPVLRDCRGRAEPHRRARRRCREGTPAMSGTSIDHELVRDYLCELDAALRGLPAAQARELKDQITTHLDDALPPDADRYLAHTPI